MLRRLVALAALGCAWAALPQFAAAAPTPVSAWYMYGTTLSGLQANANSHGCYFAQHHPGGNRTMLLDFGAARKIDANTWGAIDFSSTTFSNPSILAALKSGADGHHNCYTGTGTTDILYGNTNYHMSNVGMSSTDVYNAGFYQSQRSQDLFNYQVSKGYNKQSSDAASDMEPSWDGPGLTKQLVNGDFAQGWALYYDYGSADGCPQSGSSGSCNNGWTVGDVGYVSFHGLAVPLPEIYITAQADQWTVIRRWWNNNNGSYTFFGTTGTPGVSLTPQEGWNALNSRNSGLVLAELVCISSTNC
jgi:hypothetical protein